MHEELVGRVAAITRFPVKSMAGEPLTEAALHWPWLLGDRQYAFVKTANTSSFPWLTARDLPALVRWQARYERPDDPIHGGVTVASPEGRTFDIRDPALCALLSAQAETPVALLRLGRGCFDAMPVSVLLRSTVAAVAQAHGATAHGMTAHGATLGAPRFRANLLIETAEPAAEAGWLGHSVAIGTGGARLAVDCETPRCAMIAIDPDTAERDPAVIRTVARQFGNRVGGYCAVAQPGPVCVGDAVRLTSAFPPG